MNKKLLPLAILFTAVLVLDMWLYLSYQKENNYQLQPPIPQQQNNINQKSGSGEVLVFTPLNSPPAPLFIKSLNNAEDVKIDFHYEGDYVGSDRASDSEFFTPKGSSEKFLSLSKIKDRQDKYAYGPDYLSIFTSEESHSYQGTPIYLLNPSSKYSVSYVGFQINNRDLISELKIEFGIDYRGIDQYSVKNFKPSIFASIFGIQTAYACGPGLYLRPVGSSNLIFAGESNGVAWYQLEKTVALYDLNLNYCDDPPAPKPDYCNNMADDPVECQNYCYFNASIASLKEGNLRMHVLYKPNDKEGFLELQMVNLVLSDSDGTRFYQPIMGKNFDNYYRAYLH